MISIAVVLTFVYLIFVIVTPIIWKIVALRPSHPDPIDGISVVIPFRNEATHLKNVLECLQKISSTVDLDITLVNDHSKDDSEAMVKEFMQQSALKATLIQLKANEIGKKAAIEQGVLTSKHEWIWQIDADVTFEPAVLEMFLHQVNHEKHMYLAPVFLKQNKNAYRYHFQKNENVLLQWATAFAALIGKSFLANGANMFYKKSSYWAYKKSKTDNHYASGDDLFLLQFIKKKWGGLSIKYLAHQSAAVYTPCVQKAKDFWQQKYRWASKMEDQNLEVPLFFRFLLLISFCLPVVYLTAFLVGTIAFKTALALLLLKFFADFFAYTIIQSHYKLTGSALAFPLFLLRYPFYIIKVWKDCKKREITWKNRTI